MCHEFLDRIIVVLASILASESARQFINAVQPFAVSHEEEQNDTERNDTNESDERHLLDSNIEEDQTLLYSFKTSLNVSFTLTASTIPVSVLMIVVLFGDVNSANICFRYMQQNKSLPWNLMKYVIIGHDVEGMALNFWFQLMLILLFGWRNFKSHFTSTLVLAFVCGLLVVIYKTSLFFLRINFAQNLYRIPGNVVFLFGVIFSGYLVAKKISDNDFPHRSQNHLKKRNVFAVVSAQFFMGTFIAFAYRYVFVPWYVKTNSDIYKASIAMITPTLIIIPMVIAENLALKSLSFTDSDRIFVLVYFVNGVSILLYCIMQAGVDNLNIYIFLSLIRGVFQVFQTATVKVRQRIVTLIWQCIERRRPSCAREMEETNFHRRLKVDKEIQVMLYQSIAIIISQAYLTLYLTSNYNVKTTQILHEFIFKRLCIGIGVSFVANFFSILIHIHFHRLKLPNIWRTHWKLHLFAATVVGVMSVCYFTVVLLAVFKTFGKKSYILKTCVPPF